MVYTHQVMLLKCTGQLRGAHNNLVLVSPAWTSNRGMSQVVAGPLCMSYPLFSLHPSVSLRQFHKEKARFTV